MRRSRELGKSTLPQPPHRAHPSYPAWGLTSRFALPAVTKNSGPKKIFPIFRHMAGILAKWSAIGAAMRCERISEQLQRTDETPFPFAME
jgi:hypothetical protein